jgi:hypothetical protein
VKKSESTRSRDLFRGLGLLSFGVLFLWSCASSSVANFHLDPVKGEIASFSHEGLVLTSRYLDEDGRNEYFRTKGQEVLSRELHGLSLVTFLLAAANNSGRESILDPAGTRLITGFGPTLSPMSYAHLYMELPRGPSRQNVLKELQGIAFDRPVNVRSGERVEKVLFFKRPEKVSEDVSIVFESLYLGGSLVPDAVLRFRAFPTED